MELRSLAILPVGLGLFLLPEYLSNLLHPVHLFRILQQSDMILCPEIQERARSDKTFWISLESAIRFIISSSDFPSMYKTDYLMPNF